VLDYILAGVGLTVFVVAMAHPKWLPGRTAADREEQEREKQRHQSEVNLEARKENVRRNPTGRIWDAFGDARSRSNDRLAAAIERQNELRDREIQAESSTEGERE
jgi:hypothetical protein